MARKRYTPEQIIGMLREAEVRLSQGDKVGEISRWLWCPRKVGSRQGHGMANVTFPTRHATFPPAKCFLLGLMVGLTFWRATMNIIIILIVGGILGWLASMLMRTDEQQGLIFNVVVGIVGAVIAGYLIVPLIGGAPITSGSFDVMSLVSSFIGAVVLLAIVNLVRRGSMR